MAESTTTLQFKLVIDGKEAIGTVQLTKQELESLNQVTQQFSERPFLKQFAKDLVLIEASAEEATKGIMDFIKINELTENEIQSVINALREQQSVLAVGSTAWQQHGTAIQNLTNAYQTTAMGQQNVTQQSGSMRMAISQLGFAVGDAQMIFMDFRMFLLSIGNNLPFVVQGLAGVAQEAKTSGQSIFEFIKTNMDASMKLVLGANVLMFAIMALPPIYKAIAGAADGAKNKIKELTETMGEEEKKVRTQQKEYNALIGVIGDLGQSQKIRNEAYDELKEKYPAYISFLKSEKDETTKIAEALKLGNIQFEKKIKLAASERILKEYYEQAIAGEYNLIKLEEKKIALKNELEGQKALEKKLLLPEHGGLSYDFGYLELYSIEKEIKENEYLIQEGKKESEKLENKILELKSGIIDDPKDPEDFKEPEDSNVSSKLLNEIKLRIKLAELTGGDKDTAVKEGIALINAELNKKNLTLEREVELRSFLARLEEKKVAEKENDPSKLLNEIKLRIKLAELTGGDKDTAVKEGIALINAELDKKNLFLEREVELRSFLASLIDSEKEKAAAQEKVADLISDKKFDHLETQYEREKAIISEKHAEELREYQTLLDTKLISLEQFLIVKELLENKYAKKSAELDKKILDLKLNTYAQIANNITSIFNNLYGIIEKNARDEVSVWKNKEEEKLEEERKAALKHARTQAQREKINEQFDKRKEKLDDEANKKAKEKIATWFYINKAVSVANAVIASILAGINTMTQLSHYLPPPLPQIAMASVIAAGLSQAAVISQQKLPGYKKGGAIVGEEGPEIIAPFQDYASGQSKLIMMTMMTLRDEIRAGNINHYLPSSSGKTDFSGFKESLDKLNKHLDNGISARAYLDDKQARKITSRGSALDRKSKLI